MDKAQLLVNIAKSFRGEVSYLQGNIYSLSYETRILRWISIDTILSELAYFLDLDSEALKTSVGMDKAKVRSYDPENASNQKNGEI